MIEFDFWISLAIILAFPAQAAFLAIYTSPILGAGEWWKDFVGRALFFKAGALSTVTSVYVLMFYFHYINGTYSGVNFSIAPHSGDFFEALTTIGIWLFSLSTYVELFSIVRSRIYGPRHKVS